MFKMDLFFYDLKGKNLKELGRFAEAQELYINLIAQQKDFWIFTEYAETLSSFSQKIKTK